MLHRDFLFLWQFCPTCSCPVFSGGEAKFFPEQVVEMREVPKPALSADVDDLLLCIGKQVSGIFQPQPIDECHRCGVVVALEFTAEMLF